MNENYSIIYNPLSGNKTAKEEALKLKDLLKSDTLNFIEMAPDFDYVDYFSNLPSSTKVVLCGGDGTLNRVANIANSNVIKNEIFYYPTGSGNDFLRDITNSSEKKLVKINEYLTNLPTVSVNGIKSKFINGIGYGIDGYCCEQGDFQRENAKNNKPINYTAIAVKGVLFKYKRTTATVTVDGQTKVFKNVWLASTMKGRFYGGGMMATPNQDRKNPDKTLSILIFRGRLKIRSLLQFSSIFEGEHIKHKKNCIVLTGKNIEVSFNKPRSLQIDGETILNVSKYSVQSE